MSIHWMRIVLGALLLEIVLFAVLVPIGFVTTTVFLVAVPIGCFMFGYVVSRWVLRTLSYGLLLHGTLLGMAATAMYFALVFMQPDGLSSAIAVRCATVLVLSGHEDRGLHDRCGARSAAGLRPIPDGIGGCARPEKTRVIPENSFVVFPSGRCQAFS